MKNLSIFTVLILFPYMSMAQYEWAPIGAKWYINVLVNTDEIDYPEQLLLDYELIESTGDTIVDGMMGRKVGEYVTIQQGERVYVWMEDTIQLIYDFGVNVGDTVEFSHPRLDYDDSLVLFRSFKYCDSIAIIDIDGLPHRKFFFTEVLESGLNQYIYIERIGLMTQPIDPNYFTEYIGIVLTEWVRCYEDFEVHYRNPWLDFLEPGAACDINKLTSVYNVATTNLRLFPNPATDHVTITWPDAGVKEVTLTIMDAISGRAIYYQSLLAPFAHTLDISSWPAGMYIYQFSDERESIAVGKLIVE